MSGRHPDGSAGDANYARLGVAYSTYRRPDPRIASAIERALGTAETVLNVGAGTGSYESDDRRVAAVEPSAAMRAQRPANLAPAINAVAQALPFVDDAFDAAMTSASVHQWPDLAAGLREMRRVTRGPVVIVTGDPHRLDLFWLAEYAPDVMRAEARRMPSIPTIEAVLGELQVELLPIPLDCTDGFNEAYYGRPEILLDPLARMSCSSWSFVDAATADRYVTRLTADLASGAWDRRYGHLRTQPTFDGSLVLIVSPGDG